MGLLFSWTVQGAASSAPWFWGEGAVAVGVSATIFNSTKNGASWPVASGPSATCGIFHFGVWAPGTQPMNSPVVALEWHVASPFAQRPPLPMTGRGEGGEGALFSYRVGTGCWVLVLRDSWLRPSERSLLGEKLSLSAWTQGLWGDKGTWPPGEGWGQVSPRL